jgi:hypothetical protein
MNHSAQFKVDTEICHAVFLSEDTADENQEAKGFFLGRIDSELSEGKIVPQVGINQAY